MDARIAVAEASWPSHEHDVTMTTLPDYFLRRAAAADDLEAEATEWRRLYLENDVVHLQLLKQHHYHPYNEVAQARVPLAGCQKSDRPKLCKSDFPRTQWLCSEATVLCPCKLHLYGMPVSGRKNRLGALHGPCGHEWLNGCAPAMLAGLRGANCDVQVPYRSTTICLSNLRRHPDSTRTPPDFTRGAKGTRRTNGLLCRLLLQESAYGTRRNQGISERTWTATCSTRWELFGRCRQATCKPISERCIPKRCCARAGRML